MWIGGIADVDNLEATAPIRQVGVVTRHGHGLSIALGFITADLLWIKGITDVDHLQPDLRNCQVSISARDGYRHSSIISFVAANPFRSGRIADVDHLKTTRTSLPEAAPLEIMGHVGVVAGDSHIRDTPSSGEVPSKESGIHIQRLEPARREKEDQTE